MVFECKSSKIPFFSFRSFIFFFFWTKNKIKFCFYWNTKNKTKNETKRKLFFKNVFRNWICLPRQRILEFYEGYVSIPLIPNSYASMLPHFDSLHAIHFPIFQMLPKKIKLNVPTKWIWNAKMRQNNFNWSNLQINHFTWLWCFWTLIGICHWNAIFFDFLFQIS